MFTFSFFFELNFKYWDILPCIVWGLIYTSVVVWCDFFEFRLEFVAYFKGVDEVVNAFASHSSVGACQCLECFVGVRIGFTAQNGLDRFSHDYPAVFQVSLDAGFVQEQFAQTLHCALEGNEGVCHRYAYVSDHC